MSTLRLFKQEEPRTESEFERQVLRILINKGYKVRSQWSVGYYRIDMVVEGGGKRLAVECDGDRWHPIEKLADDMARQAILERLGWKFIRIRGSAFFRNEEEAMRPVFARLDELSITPVIEDNNATENISFVRELEEIVATFCDDELPEFAEQAGTEIGSGSLRQGEGGRAQPNSTESTISHAVTYQGSPFHVQAAEPDRGDSETEGMFAQLGASTSLCKSFLGSYVSFEGSRMSDPRNVGLESVADGLCSIIRVEGPIVAKRVYDLYLRGCGIKRLGHELRSTMNRALQSAIRQKRVMSEDEGGKGGLFFSVVRSAGDPPIKLRRRGPRSFEEIPQSELQAVGKLLVSQHGFALGSDDHLRAILECFDLKRLTTQVGTSLLETLDMKCTYVDEMLSTMGQ